MSTNLTRRGQPIRRRTGWLESVEKPEGVDATLIKKGEYNQFWRWCDHRSSRRFQALDGEPRCGLCGKKPTGTEGIA